MPADDHRLTAGLAHHQAGRLAEAEALYRRVLAEDPNHAMASYLAGVLACQSGRFADAEAVLTRAVQLRPAFPEALYTLGNALLEQGRRDEAILRYQEAVHLQPAFPEALVNLGTALEEQGRLTEAVGRYREALRRRPAYPEALASLGRALKALGRTDQAIARYREALRLKPAFPEALYNLANALREQGNGAEAIPHYQQALTLRPAFPEALANLGLAFQQQGDLDRAAEGYRQALALRPAYPEALFNLANVHQLQGELEAAVLGYRQALALQPAYPEALSNLGSALQEQGRLDQAIACYQQALALRPNLAQAALNLALARLQGGDFETGWRQYEWRWRKPDMVPHGQRQPLWDGARLDGRRILLHCEQGFGDSLQFIRYARLVKAMGAQEVVLLCPRPLVRLLGTAPGIDRVVTDPTESPACDCQAPLLSLPWLLGTTLASVPAEVPYLSPEPARVAAWRERLRFLDGFRIGVAWQGNPRNRLGRSRSYPLAALAALAALPGVRLVSVQQRDGLEQLATLPPGMTVTTLAERVDGDGDAFVDTAAIMACLDLVVSADTAVAHLAGALARPVWLASTEVPDWRWLLDRADSPWYPTLRLFRQSGNGGWAPVFARMAAELAPMLEGTPSSPRPFQESP